MTSDIEVNKIKNLCFGVDAEPFICESSPSDIGNEIE